jgi:hypothetical protein
MITLRYLLNLKEIILSSRHFYANQQFTKNLQGRKIKHALVNIRYLNT